MAKQRGNPFLTKPTPEAPGSYLLGYLDCWIPEWIDSPEQLAILYNQVLDFRQKRSELQAQMKALKFQKEPELIPEFSEGMV
jgi:hypothetical protein